MQTLLVILTIIAIISTIFLPHIVFCVIFYHRKRTTDAYRGLTGDDLSEVKREFLRNVDEIMKLQFEDVYIESYDGLKLHARYRHTSDDAPLQIQFHGYKSFALRDFSWGGSECVRHGHNLLLVDHRAHGESESHTISFGINERRDVLSWVRYATRRFGRDKKIILMGISMGAATVLMASDLPLPRSVVGIVADCPYSSPKEIIQKVARDRGFPPRTVYMLARLGAIAYGRFDPGAASAIESVRGAKVPILLFHGEADGFVPVEMSLRIAEASSLVELHTFPGAEHALSFLSDKERYAKVMNEFIDRVTVAQ